MDFTSLGYLAFLAVVLAVFWVSPARARPVVLLVASYVFYATRSPLFVVLLAVVTAISFLAGRALPNQAPDRATWTRRTAVAAMVAIPFGFKIAMSLSPAGSPTLFEGGAGASALLLPIGLSYYTFQAVSYVVDISRGDVEPTGSWVDHAAFVSYFPHLLAGPVVRAKRLIPQIDPVGGRRPRPDVAGALLLLLLGWFKKVAVADPLLARSSELLDGVFDGRGEVSGVMVVVATVAMLVGLFFDLAAYVDMARGSSRLFGIELPRNYVEPLTRSRDLTDFWRRWQTTVMGWFRDYVYRPLRGSDRSDRRELPVLVATFVIVGLWHGLTVGWVVFGVVNGLVLWGERLWSRRRARSGGGRAPAAVGLVYVYVALLLAYPWAVAGSWSRGVAFYTGVFGLSGGPTDWTLVVYLAYAAVVLVLSDGFDRRTQGQRQLGRMNLARSVAVGLMIVGVVVFSGAPAREFIYFRF